MEGLDLSPNCQVSVIILLTLQSESPNTSECIHSFALIHI